MTDKKNEKPAEDVPNFQQSLEQLRKQDAPKILEKIDKEREEKDIAQRFGYFTIPYPAIVGDQAYSQENNYNHQVVDRKVITEKRGIFTQPPKVGKANDVYFAPIEGDSKETIAHNIELNKQEKEALFAEIKRKKETTTEIPNFRPCGPQSQFGYYQNIDKNYKPDGQLYKEKDRFRFIDKDNRKVITEKRGIYPQKGYWGPNPIPNDYFSYPVVDKELEDKLKAMAAEDKKARTLVKSKSEKVYRKPFAPASLKKNDAFASDKETYALYDDATYKRLLEENKELKKKGRPRYENVLPKGALKHDAPFRSARLVWNGRDGLFNDDLYKLQCPLEEKKVYQHIREQREKERQAQRVPFHFNRLMNHSTFAPSLLNFQTNLKREFPTVFKY